MTSRTEVDRVEIAPNPRHAFPVSKTYVYRADGSVVVRWGDEARWRTVGKNVSADAWAEMRREMGR
jgi:hypothetical protein